MGNGNTVGIRYMTINAETLRKLAILNLSPEQMAAVLNILADDIDKEEERKKKQTERKRRSRDGNVTVTGKSQDNVVTVTPKVFPLNAPLLLSPTPPNNNPPLIPHSKFLPDFEKFWEMYPRQRRGSRTGALRAFLKSTRQVLPEKIIDGLKRYLSSDDVIKGFAKGAQAWLNDEGWENTYSTPSRLLPGTVRQLTPSERSDIKMKKEKWGFYDNRV